MRPLYVQEIYVKKHWPRDLITYFKLCENQAEVLTEILLVRCKLYK